MTLSPFFSDGCSDIQECFLCFYSRETAVLYASLGIDYDFSSINLAAFGTEFWNLFVDHHLWLLRGFFRVSLKKFGSFTTKNREKQGIKGNMATPTDSEKREVHSESNQLCVQDSHLPLRLPDNL